MANESMKDIAKIVKGTLKQKYPNYSFSVSSKEYPSSLDIVWYEADFYPFADISNRTMLNTNVYYIDETKGLTAKGLEVLKDIYNTAIQFQESYGDSYHRSSKFYLDIDLGTFDKPFTVIARKKELTTVTSPSGTTTTTTSDKGKGWDWGDLIRGNNGWSLYSKILPDGRHVYSLVKQKATPPNKEKWNEIRGELSTETGFKWSPRSQSFQYWGNLYNKSGYLEILDKIFAIMGKYYGFDQPKVEPTIEITQANVEPEPIEKPFLLNESYKSIPDNPKLDYFTIKWAEGYPEYTDLLPKTFKSYKQANKFIEDNVDMEEGGYDKHGVEWKFNFLDMVFTDRWDIGKKLNPKDWSNIWAKEILSSLFYNILTDRLSPDDIHNNEALYTELGKDGFELTTEDFYKIVNDFCDVNNTQVNVIKNYTTTQSRIDKLKESLPKIFSLFDKKDEQVVTPEMIQKQIDSLSILAKYGDELAARKIKILQILLKK